MTRTTRMVAATFAATMFAAASGLGWATTAIADEPALSTEAPATPATPATVVGMSESTSAEVTPQSTAEQTPEPAQEPTVSASATSVPEASITPTAPDPAATTEAPAADEPAATDSPATEAIGEPTPAVESTEVGTATTPLALVESTPPAEAAPAAVAPMAAVSTSPAGESALQALAAPTITLTKAGFAVDVTGDGIVWEGDWIFYNFTVTNDGDTTLESLAVADPLLSTGVTCGPLSLAPGETASCYGNDPYTITAADEAAGSVTNAAVATMTDPATGAIVTDDDSITTRLTPHGPELTLDKTVSPSYLVVEGSHVGWLFVIQNTGSVPLDEVTLSDPFLVQLGVQVNCFDPQTGAPTASFSLAPGASTTCYSDPYVLTAADVANGDIVNTATVEGVCSDGSGCTASDDDSATLTVAEPILTLNKVVDELVDVNGNGFTDTGDTITWKFTISNDGNVAVADIQLTDPMLDDAQVDYDCPPNEPGGMRPGQSKVCNSDTYTVTAADLAAGSVVNSASVDGQCYLTGGGGNNRQAKPLRKVTLDARATAGGPRCVANTRIKPATDSTTTRIGEEPKPTPTPTPTPTPSPTEPPTPTASATTVLPPTSPTVPPTSEPTSEPTKDPTDKPSKEPTKDPGTGTGDDTGHQGSTEETQATQSSLPSTGGPSLLIGVGAVVLALLGGLFVLFTRKQTPRKH